MRLLLRALREHCEVALVLPQELGKPRRHVIDPSQLQLALARWLLRELRSKPKCPLWTAFEPDVELYLNLALSTIEEFVVPVLQYLRLVHL